MTHYLYIYPKIESMTSEREGTEYYVQYVRQTKKGFIPETKVFYDLALAQAHYDAMCNVAKLS